MDKQNNNTNKTKPCPKIQKIVLIFGDQLLKFHPSLFDYIRKENRFVLKNNIDTTLVVMLESLDLSNRQLYNPQKLWLVYTSMRNYKDYLQSLGIKVAYFDFHCGMEFPDLFLEISQSITQSKNQSTAQIRVDEADQNTSNTSPEISTKMDSKPGLKTDLAESYSFGDGYLILEYLEVGDKNFDKLLDGLFLEYFGYRSENRSENYFDNRSEGDFSSAFEKNSGNKTDDHFGYEKDKLKNVEKVLSEQKTPVVTVSKSSNSLIKINKLSSPSFVFKLDFLKSYFESISTKKLLLNDFYIFARKYLHIFLIGDDYPDTNPSNPEIKTDSLKTSFFQSESEANTGSRAGSESSIIKTQNILKQTLAGYYNGTETGEGDSKANPNIDLKGNPNGEPIHKQIHKLINSEQEIFYSTLKSAQNSNQNHQKNFQIIKSIQNLKAKPYLGKWSFDEENRQKYPKNFDFANLKNINQESLFENSKNQAQNPMVSLSNKGGKESQVKKELLELYRLGKIKTGLDYQKSLQKLYWQTDHLGAEKALKNFVQKLLENFGDYEDALSYQTDFGFHSTLSPYLNLGLLTPFQVLELVLESSQKIISNGKYNSLEGFVRQIIGWREWVRALYFCVYHKDPLEYNFFGAKNKLPAYFWNDGLLDAIIHISQNGVLVDGEPFTRSGHLSNTDLSKGLDTGAKLSPILNQNIGKSSDKFLDKGFGQDDQSITVDRGILEDALSNDLFDILHNIPLQIALKKAFKYGYNHHIERLMILANAMTMAEIDPMQAYSWFMSMYVDGYEWVMFANVFGMGIFADGGIFATKPYIAGGNYIKKMSDYNQLKSSLGRPAKVQEKKTKTKRIVGKALGITKNSANKIQSGLDLSSNLLFGDSSEDVGGSAQIDQFFVDSLMDTKILKNRDWEQVWTDMFWDFLMKHRDFFAKNPRLAMLIKSKINKTQSDNS